MYLTVKVLDDNTEAVLSVHSKKGSAISFLSKADGDNYKMYHIMEYNPNNGATSGFKAMHDKYGKILLKHDG